MVNRWVILTVLFLARTAMGFQFQSVAAVSPVMVPDLALDLALFGTLVGAWMLPGIPVAIPGGLLGRRFGDKQVTLVGLALMAAGSFLTAAAAEYWTALAGRVISGTGAVLLNVLLAKMVADWFSDRHLATAMGILVTSWPLGIGVALVVLGPVSTSTSWPFALQLSAWICVLALIIVAAIYQRPPARAAQVALAEEPMARLSRRELGLASLSGTVWALYNVGYIIVVSFAPLLLAERGLHAGHAALVSSAATWPLVLSVPLGGILADRTGRGGAIMQTSFLTMAACIPLMLIAPSPVLMLALIGLMTGPAAGIIMSLPARALRPQTRNLGMGVYYTWYYVGMAVLPGIAGWCRDVSGVAIAPLIFASALLLVTAACTLLFEYLERRSAQVRTA